MDADPAGARVDALDDDLARVEADERADDLVVRVVRGRDADGRADGEPRAGIDAARGERGAPRREQDRLGARHLLVGAVPERLDALVPDVDAPVALEMRRDGRRAAHEPDRLHRREVGDRRQGTEEERPLVAEEMLEPAEVVVEVRRLVVQRRAPKRGRHRRAIGAERLHRLGRDAGEDVRDARRLHREGHRGPEQRLVGPLADDRGEAVRRLGIERRLGHEPVDDAAHQRRVAVHVGADLHERRAPVAARQGDDVGLGQHVRHRHRAPVHPLHAEDEAHLLRERRGRVVMEDRRVHRGRHRPAARVASCGRRVAKTRPSVSPRSRTSAPASAPLSRSSRCRRGRW